MKNLGDEVARSRVNKSWLERLYYQFPPRLADPDKDIPQNVTNRLREGNFVLVTKFENNDVSINLKDYISFSWSVMTFDDRSNCSNLNLIESFFYQDNLFNF